MQNELQHKAEPALCAESAVQQQSRMRRVASADSMVLQHPARQKRKHRRRPTDKVAVRRGSDAGRCRSPACAKHAVN